MRVVNQPVKLGWIGGELYLEVNPGLRRSRSRLDETGKLGDAEPPSALREQVERAAGEQAGRVDWALVERIASHRYGIPRAYA